MPNFRHTPDDTILFDNDSMPLAFFQTLEPLYSLPVGMTSRVYEQGSYHILSDGNTQISGDMPYTDGDSYITNKAVYLAAYAASLLIPPTLASAKTDKLADLSDYYASITGGDVITTSGQFTSRENFALYQQYYIYNAIGALPIGYSVIDTTGAAIAVAALADLFNIITAFTDLGYYANITKYVHTQIINSLPTIPDIDAYDYEVGWAIVPYTYGISFYAAYYNSINGTSGLGVLTGTAAGGAAIVDYALDLNHSDARYVDYDANLNADAQQIGTVKFVVIPNYTGTPAADHYLFSICQADADITNLLSLHHSSADGKLYLTAYDQADAPISLAGFDVWSPTSGTQYEFILHYDFTAGATALYIDGAQLGITNTATGVRGAAIGLLRVGSSYNSGAAAVSNFGIRFFMVTNN
jgi:hypothetical protein